LARPPMLDRIKEGLYFDSVKLVTIRNLKLAVLHRFMQFCVLAYIVVFAIWYKQGYQATSDIKGVIYTKVKGVSYADDDHGTTYDAGDLVIPGSENGAVFIATRALRTIQHQGECPDDSDLTKNNCTVPKDCVNGSSTTYGWVVPDACNLATRKCNVSAWCPVEVEDPKQFTAFANIEEWTLFIRSEVTYPSFKNTPRFSNAEEVQEGVNLFRVSYMLKGQDMDDVFLNGAIISVSLDWSCNFDNEQCHPKITFDRVDTNTSASRGFNFRSVIYTDENKTDTTNTFKSRVLTKYYGIRFVLGITGLGRKFDVFTTAITFGSGIAFFAGATLATDWLLQYLHPRREKFNAAKHKQFTLEDEESGYLRQNDDDIPDQAHSINSEN